MQELIRGERLVGWDSHPNWGTLPPWVDYLASCGARAMFITADIPAAIAPTINALTAGTSVVDTTPKDNAAKNACRNVLSARTNNAPMFTGWLFILTPC